jgi:hypothetical protein
MLSQLDSNSDFKARNNSAQRIRVQDTSTWIKLSGAHFRLHGGEYLLGHFYDGSVLSLLSTLFPENNWKINIPSSSSPMSQFCASPVTMTDREWEDTVRNFCDRFATLFAIKNQTDWYNISIQDFVVAGMSV